MEDHASSQKRAETEERAKAIRAKIEALSFYQFALV